MTGNKETKEAVIGILAVAAVLAERLKDGVQPMDDSLAVWDKVKNDEVFKAKLAAAYENIKLVPVEVKDMGLEESFDLLTSVAPEIITLVKALKK